MEYSVNADEWVSEVMEEGFHGDQANKAIRALEAILEIHAPVKKGDENWDADMMVGRTVYCLRCSSGQFDWPVRLEDCRERRTIESILGGES